MTMATLKYSYESEGNKTRSIKCQNLNSYEDHITPAMELRDGDGERLKSSDQRLVWGLTGPQNGKTRHLKSLSFYSWAPIDYVLYSLTTDSLSPFSK